MPSVPVSRPWKRFLRFNVRGLIVLVLVLGAGLGWMVRSARVQRDAVAAITKTGGSVRYSSVWTSNSTPETRQPWVPKWLEKAIGADYFAHVSVVNFYKPGCEKELVQVGRLPALVPGAR